MYSNDLYDTYRQLNNTEELEMNNKTEFQRNQENAERMALAGDKCEYCELSQIKDGGN